MRQFSGLESTLVGVFETYRQNANSGNPRASIELDHIEGEPVNFIIASDNDTIRISVGIPHATFDEPLPKNIDEAPGFEGFTQTLERAVLKTRNLKTDLSLTKARENPTWAIYHAEFPLVGDVTEE